MSSSRKSSRRSLLKRIALGASLAPMAAEAAQHVHHATAQETKAAGGVYKPKCFTPAEYRSLSRLADLIIPADSVSKGALEAGAPAFIDLLSSQNAELAAIFTGGLAWLDRVMERRHGKPFADCTPAEQTALLDVIAFKKNTTADNAAGVAFFDWARKMVVDAFYTSPMGIKDIDYRGNKGMTVFQVPVEALNHALKRLPAG